MAYDKYKTNQKTYTYIGADGNTYYLDFTGDGWGDDGGYILDDALAAGKKKHLAIAVALFMQKGKNPTREEYNAALVDAGVSGGRSDQIWDRVLTDIETFKTKNSITDDYSKAVEKKQEDSQSSAFNDYYTDLYSLEPNTSGRAMYDELSNIYLRQAEAGKTLADVQFQQQAMQQAQTVKAITDQVRAERMARLRSGMSEFQIANQDMQMMMANVDALNQNAQMLNQQRLESQMNADLAQDQAYLSYLEQSGVRGQTAAAMYAADSGNAHWNALQYMKNNPGVSYEDAHKAVTGLKT